MVKVARFHQFGDPDVLQFDELPLNDPGEREVRVRVSAMSLNRSDLLWMENNYVETPKLSSKNEIYGI